MMIVVQSSTPVDSFSRLLSVYGLQQTLLCEQHCEVIVLPYMCKITNTDYGVGLGLPPAFWSGRYTKEGEKRMIKLQRVIHHGAWKAHLRKPEGYQLPPGFTIVHFSLTASSIDFTRFFINDYSKDYKSLPEESKKHLYHSARACSLLESFEEKVLLEQQGLGGFACREVFERYMEVRRLRKEGYPKGIKNINANMKAYRNSDGKYGYPPEVGAARRAVLYSQFNEEAERLANRPLSVTLPPLPIGMPQFKLLDVPSAEAFALRS